MIYIYPITFCFSLFFNWVTALDLCTKWVSPKYLPNKWLYLEKILLVLLSKFKMHTKSECSGEVSWQLKLLFHWVSGAGRGIRLYRLLIFAFSSTLQHNKGFRKHGDQKCSSYINHGLHIKIKVVWRTFIAWAKSISVFPVSDYL